MTTASPLFSFVGVVTPLAKKTVAAATSFSAALDDITGITSVEWSILSTDETSTPASYMLTTSGIKGSIVTLTSLGLGTAALLQCKVNAGLDPQTGQPSPAMTATALFEVLLANGGSVGVVGETTQRDGVFGSLIFLNQLARLQDATAAVLGTRVVAPTPTTVPLRGTAGELQGVRFETGPGGAQSGTVRLPNAAAIKARTSDGLSDTNMITATGGVISIGDILYTSWIKFFTEAGSSRFTYTNGAAIVLDASAAGIGLLSALDAGSGTGVVSIYKATLAPSVPPLKGFIIYVDPTSNNLMALSASGTLRTIALF